MTVTTITLPVPFSVRAVNCYLLEGDPLTLVDPGADWPETVVELDASLAARGLRVEDVEQVVLTHQHYDHVGLAHTVRERSGATVVAHELLRGFLADLPGQMELEDTYQAEVMRLHGVPEAAIAEASTPSPASTASTAAPSRSTARSATATSSRRAAAASSSASARGTARRTRSSSSRTSGSRSSVTT